MSALHKVKEVFTKNNVFHELDMHSLDNSDVCLVDFIGHMGRHIDRFDGVHGGNGVSQNNQQGRK